MKIGVFDSGIGGLSVAKAIEKALPMHQIIFRDDSPHLPYGTKTIEEIYNFCLPVLQSLVADGCECIVVACNTVTTNIISRLRRVIAVPLVGMEPMVKPAASATKSGVIIVCATPRTLESERYAYLKSQFAAGVEVLEPDCRNWAELIENNLMNEEHIAAAIKPGLEKGADVVVLGCTHYHWIEERIKEYCQNKALVMQPELPVIQQLQRVIAPLV